MTTRSGPDAMNAAVAKLLANAPPTATGIYIDTTGVTFGYRKYHYPHPNFIFFDAPPTQSYSET